MDRTEARMRIKEYYDRIDELERDIAYHEREIFTAEGLIESQGRDARSRDFVRKQNNRIDGLRSAIESAKEEIDRNRKLINSLSREFF